MRLVLGGLAVAVVALVVALMVSLRGDPPPPEPSPFEEPGMGGGLVACKSICDDEERCATATWKSGECVEACRMLVGVRAIQPSCEQAFTDAFSCWWRATARCAPEDACSADWRRAYGCVCGLPDLPPAMQARCDAPSTP